MDPEYTSMCISSPFEYSEDVEGSLRSVDCVCLFLSVAFCMEWCEFVSKGFVGGEYVRFILVCVGHENSMNCGMRSESKPALQFRAVSGIG